MSARFLRYTLMTDGSSDRALMPILDWLITNHGTVPFRGQWAEYLPKGKLVRKIELALALYPCDILFVHRDGETADYGTRRKEIEEAVNEQFATWVPVIPIRMTESWLLCSENAIRSASGNPNGKVQLDLPGVKRIEGLPDPKEILFDLLRTASGLTGRRLDKFNHIHARSLVSQRTEDFSVLRNLAAFQQLEAAVKQALSRIAGDIEDYPGA